MTCKCGSRAINHHSHGRDGSRGDLCDVCFWREKASALEDHIARLEEALDCVVPSCNHLHHAKKHQHKLGKPCPVELLIRQAKEAKP